MKSCNLLDNDTNMAGNLIEIIPSSLIDSKSEIYVRFNCAKFFLYLIFTLKIFNIVMLNFTLSEK